MFIYECVCVCTVAKRAQKIVNLFFMPSSKFTAILVLHSVAAAETATTTTTVQSATLYRRLLEGKGRCSSLCCFRGCQFVSWQFLVPLQKFFMKTLCSPSTACSASVSASARSLRLAVFFGLQPLQSVGQSVCRHSWFFCVELTIFLIETPNSRRRPKSFLFANLQPLRHCTPVPKLESGRQMWKRAAQGGRHTLIERRRDRGRRRNCLGPEAVLFVFQFVRLLQNYALLSACCSLPVFFVWPSSGKELLMQLA